MLRVFQSLVCVAALLIVATTVQAGAIPVLVNTTTGATVFDDDFEAGSMGWAPDSAIVGDWAAVAGTGQTVTVDTLAGFGAAQGSKFLGVNATNTYVLKAKGIENSGVAGDVMTMNLAFRAPAGVESSIYMLGPDHTTQLLQLGIWGPDANNGFPGFANTVRAVKSDGSAWVKAADENPNIWNRLTVTHTNMSSQWSISVNGGTPFVTNGYAGSATNVWSSIMFSEDAPPATIGYDAYDPNGVVPEPSSCVLCAIGLIGLMAYAWRKRR